MNTLTIPTPIKRLETESKSSIELYSDENFSIILEKFSTAEKEEIFGVTNLKFLDNNIYQLNKKTFYVSQTTHNYIYSNYKLVIKGEDEGLLINSLMTNLDLAFRIIVKYGLNIYYLKEKKSRSETASFITYSDEDYLLKDADLQKIKSFLKISIPNELAQKNIFLKFLLETAMRVENMNNGIAPAFYVIILESIFLRSNEREEKRQKFAKRITKFLNKDDETCRYLKKIYDKRSDLFHGRPTKNKNKFTNKDLIYLKDITHPILEEYIINPKRIDKINIT